MAVVNSLSHTHAHIHTYSVYADTVRIDTHGCSKLILIHTHAHTHIQCLFEYYQRLVHIRVVKSYTHTHAVFLSVLCRDRHTWV